MKSDRRVIEKRSCMQNMLLIQTENFSYVVSNLLRLCSRLCVLGFQVLQASLINLDSGETTHSAGGRSVMAPGSNSAHRTVSG